MSPLELALVILVSIWTMIFVIIAITFIMLSIYLKKGLDKIDHMLKTADETVVDVSSAAKSASSNFGNAFSSVGLEMIKKLFFQKRNSRES